MPNHQQRPLPIFAPHPLQLNQELLGQVLHGDALVDIRVLVEKDPRAALLLPDALPHPRRPEPEPLLAVDFGIAHGRGAEVAADEAVPVPCPQRVAAGAGDCDDVDGCFIVCERAIRVDGEAKWLF